MLFNFIVVRIIHPVIYGKKVKQITIIIIINITLIIIVIIIIIIIISPLWDSFSVVLKIALKQTTSTWTDLRWWDYSRLYSFFKTDNFQIKS